MKLKTLLKEVKLNEAQGNQTFKIGFQSILDRNGDPITPFEWIVDEPTTVGDENLLSALVSNVDSLYEDSPEGNGTPENGGIYIIIDGKLDTKTKSEIANSKYETEIFKNDQRFKVTTPDGVVYCQGLAEFIDTLYDLETEDEDGDPTLAHCTLAFA